MLVCVYIIRGGFTQSARGQCPTGEPAACCLQFAGAGANADAGAA